MPDDMRHVFLPLSSFPANHSTPEVDFAALPTQRGLMYPARVKAKNTPKVLQHEEGLIGK